MAIVQQTIAVYGKTHRLATFPCGELELALTLTTFRGNLAASDPRFAGRRGRRSRGGEWSLPISSFAWAHDGHLP
jgi:hypothetical protein